MSLQSVPGYPYALTPPVPRVRSTAVTVIALLAMLGGSLAFIVAVVGLALGGMAALMGFINGAVGGLAVAVMLILLTYAIGSIAVGIGLWQLKEWAWPWAIVYEALSFNILLILILVGSRNWISAFIGMVISIIVIYVLYRPDVQRQFNRP